MADGSLQTPITPASLGPPPRTVKLRGISPRWRFLIVIFLIPFYTLAFVLTGHVILSLLTPVLGTPIPGTTISTRIDTEGEDDHNIYKLYYTYQLNGQKIQTWDKLPQSDFQQIHANPHPQPITVYYLSLGPFSRSNPNTLSSQFGRIFCLIIVTIIWDTVFLGAAIYYWLKHRKIKHLLQHGAATSGIIVSKRKVDSSDHPEHYITYSYTHPFTGQTLAIECHIDAKPWESARTNQTVTVIYDPDQPHKSLVYEFSYYKIILGSP
jgi:hypothetical protein